MKRILRISQFIFALGLTSSAFAQQNGVVRCYTVENEAIRAAQNPNAESAEHFDHWLDSIIQEKKQHRIIGGVYQIPVIFHVVYKGTDGVGTGTNISQAALQSQIDVLNEDYRRKVGSNGYNTNPVGADCEIEFCLAQRKPDGTGFPIGQEGVERINSNTSGWGSGPFTTTYIDNNIKPATSWDPSRYMNIWIVNMSGGILGYAQFPTSSLGGMGCGSQNDLTDGVVFLSSSIGKSSVTGFPAPYNEGRTATHEIGHWLGLRHIWGDGGCSVDDYCNDTPLAAAANYNCPTGTNSCTAAPDAGPDMIDNYMDYTDDLCMDIFTEDQKMRMRTVLESSPLRLSLINSDACIPPSPADVSVIDILNPMGDNCPGSLTPTVVLKNRGSNTITSATISYTIDNGTVTTFSYSGNLASGATTNVNLPAFTTPLGLHTFTAYSTLPNGVPDPNPLYDTVSIQFYISNGFNAPFAENFDGDIFPPTIRWVVDNENSDCYEWQGASAFSISGQLNNNTAQFPGFGDNSTSTEDLITPIFILPCNASSANIKFDVAYQKKSSGSNERLFIEISEDCGTTWNATPIYDKSGTTLATVSGNNTNYFAPTAASQWRSETVDLTSFITGTSKNVKFRFRANGNNGNNVYVDNFQFNATTSAEINVTVAGVDVLDEGYYDFGTVSIGTPIAATFTVKNTGTSNLTLTPPLTVTGTGYTLTTTFGTTTVAAGATTTFKITFTPPSGGPFTGNVSFGTNDCDEGTYNFILKGAGAVVLPVADFTATPLSVCTGSTVTFTDASTNTTSWAWNFGSNATPQTSTSQNPTVTYNTAGVYPVTLTATNTDGSDVETKTNYITVVSGTGAALPLSEGFVSGTFPPAGWSITNLNNSTTWVRSTAAGNIPTTGNSMMFDNANIDDTGDSDLVVLKALDFSSLSTAQLKFDVAYARYDATYFDGLQVTVSAGCGTTSSTIVYNKSGSTLATAPDYSSNVFTPTAAQWRTETVDLTPFIGNSKVVVSFKNIAGYGQRLFVDNINLTGASAPIASFTTSSTSICEGESVTFTNTSTNSPTSYAWTFTGGTPGSSSATNPTVTYNTAGTYSVTLTATNGDGTDDTTMTNLITVTALPTITSTTPNSRCGAGTVTLGATASAGTISWFANATGGTALATGTSYTTPSISGTTTYYVEVSNNGCTSPTRTAVIATINTVPTIASGTLTNPSACGNTDGSIKVTGTGTGDLSWTGTASGSANSITLPHTITGLGSGPYNITFTSSQGCVSNVLNKSLTDPSAPATPTISAGGPLSFCPGGSVVLTSSSATNNVWSTGETTVSITVNSTENITVTVGTTCTATSEVTAVTEFSNPPTPTISASGPLSFCTGDSVILTSSSSTDNVWSTTQTTSSITVYTSGNYDVTVSNSDGCSVISIATVVVENSIPTITSSTPGSNCGAGTVSLGATASSGTISWFSSPSGGTSLGSGTSFTTPSISSNTDFYAEVTDNGCTSPRTSVLAEILSQYNSNESDIVCFGDNYTYPDGTTASNITSTVNHTSNLTSQGGCDSIIVTTINVQTIDTTIITSGFSFVVNQTGAQYQWIACKDNSNIAGETFQSFTPSTNGDYAVTVTLNGCSETTSCHHLTGLSIKENTATTLDLNLYPNPSSGNAVLKLSEVTDYIQVSILSVNGQLILENNYQQTDKINFDLSEMSDGIYFFKIQANQTVEVIKFVKEK